MTSSHVPAIIHSHPGDFYITLKGQDNQQVIAALRAIVRQLEREETPLVTLRCSRRTNADQPLWSYCLALSNKEDTHG